MRSIVLVTNLLYFYIIRHPYLYLLSISSICTFYLTCIMWVGSNTYDNLCVKVHMGSYSMTEMYTNCSADSMMETMALESSVRPPGLSGGGELCTEQNKYEFIYVF